jgi:two-component system chemotaxis sensor kinase CheA
LIASVDLKDFLAGFLAEAEEHLTSASANLLAVEASLSKGEPSPRPIRELFRSLHTIKGLSGMVGVEPIVDISHAMETVLRVADRAGGLISAEALELLVKGLQAIEERVGTLARGGTASPAPKDLKDGFDALDLEAGGGGALLDAALSLAPALFAKLTAAERQEIRAAIAAHKRVLRVEFTPSPSRADELNITSVRERVSRIAEIVRVLPVSVAESAAAPGGLSFVLILVTEASDGDIAEAAGAQANMVVPIVAADGDAPAESVAAYVSEDAVDAPEGPRGAFVRVDVSRLDDSLEALSALVVNRFKLKRAIDELSARGADVRDLTTIVAESGRQLRDLRAAIMRIRMVSVRSLLERVPLLVRGLGRVTGKSVSLEMDTGDSALDKGVAERVFPAIIHLLRNAVDHGIESREGRRAAGKPDEGTIRITCFQRSNNQLELTISDDGRGMNRKQVAERAGAPIPKDDAQLLELITRPGISTAERVTTTSGRGLGMDIVKRVVVSDLGGELLLETTEGKGTAFKLRIPLSITIVDAFSFVCGGERFVTPVAAVEEIVEVDAKRVVRVPHTQHGRSEAKMLERRGEAVPLLALDRMFGLAGASATGPGKKALVVRSRTDLLAFEIERMLGQQEVVVRPLEDPLVRVAGVSGATDLGDGKPTLVVDLAALGDTLLESRELTA